MGTYIIHSFAAFALLAVLGTAVQYGLTSYAARRTAKEVEKEAMDSALQFLFDQMMVAAADPMCRGLYQKSSGYLEINLRQAAENPSSEEAREYLRELIYELLTWSFANCSHAFDHLATVENELSVVSYHPRGITKEVVLRLSEKLAKAQEKLRDAIEAHCAIQNAIIALRLKIIDTQSEYRHD